MLPARTARAQELAALEQQARAEGGMMFYSGMDEPTSRALTDGFARKYGIRAQMFRAGSEITPKYQLELHNKAVIADVVQESNMPAFVQMARSDQLAKWNPPEAVNLEPGLSTPYFSVIGTIAFSWMWNTRQVDEANTPKSWNDFLRPEWQGRLGMPDMDSSGSGPPLQWYYMMRQRLGLDYMRRLGQQKFRFYGIFGDLANAVASGEVIATPTMLSYYTLQLQRRGAPLQDRLPDPTFVTDRPMALAKDSPHPAAGKLFLNYCLSKEGQEVLTKFFAIPSRRDVQVPAGIPLPGTFKALRIENWDEMAAQTGALQDELRHFFKA
ncbi:MAG: ABC transporter substrate-binding protein [Nevskiales bacterium]